MNFFWEAVLWIFAPEQQVGQNAIVARLGEHLYFTAISLLVATVIAVPIGYFIGHTGKGRELAVGLSGAARALPSLGLLTVLTLSLGFSQASIAAVVVLLVLGVPSILAGAYSGIHAIDAATIDSARAVGMSEWQILIRVEIPLGLPLLLGGIRSAALQIVATATLAAYVGLGGLGVYIFKGLPLRDLPQMLAGALLIAFLAVTIDALVAVVQKFAVPRGVTVGARTHVRLRSTRSQSAVGNPT
ncbi:MAG: ABC transporter permease [Microbacteriaceae bacterium]